MFELKAYTAVQSLEQADELLHADKKNVVLGGLLWMRMGRKQYHTGIDLSGLGMDRIEEAGDWIEMGCMVTLRQMETSPVLRNYFGSFFSRALGHIVGVQFRNCATLGGSVFGRFSFSDVATALLALDAEVELVRGGVLPLADFLATSPGRDILVKVRLPKAKRDAAYQSLRNSATDFPVLACAVARGTSGWRIVLGARPGRAKPAPGAAALLPVSPSDADIDGACERVGKEVAFGANQRAGAAYREMTAPVLVKRGIQAICR